MHDADTPSVVQPGGYTGGAGFTDHVTRDPFPRWTSAAIGLTALGVVAIVGGGLWAMNPSFQQGTSGGTASQLGSPARAGGAAGGGPADEGMALVAQGGCGSCHVIPGIQGATGVVGPSLAGVGGKTTIAAGAVEVHGPEDLARWIMDPPALKPGTLMPNLGISEADAMKMAAYLETLK